MGRIARADQISVVLYGRKAFSGNFTLKEAWARLKQANALAVQAMFPPTSRDEMRGRSGDLCREKEGPPEVQNAFSVSTPDER